MKKLGMALLLAVLVSGVSLAQRGTSEVTIKGKKVEVEYGRPALQGRDMLSRLPVGETWRMGSNAATTLKSDGTLKFGDKTLAPGTYRLTAKRVAEEQWHLVITQDSGAVEVPLSGAKATEPVETFTITLSTPGGDKGRFQMSWGTLNVGADFTVQ